MPGYPPAKALTDHLAAHVGEPAMARYTDILGLPALREALAGDIGAFYGAAIAAEQVVITAGCNQGFCLAILALARAGDEIILPLPYYFNHQMWFDMQGIRAGICRSGPSAAACLTRRMRRPDRTEDARDRAGDAQQPDRRRSIRRRSSPRSSDLARPTVWRS